MHPVLPILTAIEKELIALQLWSDQRPSEQALASTQPFCIDTLSLPEWIQFVLLERLRFMIEQEMPLPTQSGVAAMAEEYFKSMEAANGLIERLNHLDQELQNEITR